MAAPTLTYNAWSNEIIIDGVGFSRALFQELAEPPPESLYSFRRYGRSVIACRATAPDNTSHLADVITKTRLGVHDLVIYRTAHMSMDAIHAFRQRLREGAPHWKGELLVLHEGADLEALPPDQLRGLYAHLKLQFEGRRS